MEFEKFFGDQLMEDWLQEYVELMFGKNHTRDSMNVAAEIKYQHMPSALYKYRSFSENSLNAFRDDCLYSSSIDKLNDVRESPIVFLMDNYKRRELQKAYDKQREIITSLPEAKIENEYDIAKILHEQYSKENIESKPYPEPGNEPFIDSLVAWSNSLLRILIKDDLRSMRKRYNICCFSATCDEDLMWAHYADSHKGFCIQYDFKSLGILDERVQLLFPIIYQDSPRVAIEDLQEADGSLVMFAMTLKASNWKYEQEWRRFFQYSEEPHPESMPKPQAVYLGMKVSNENKAKMKELCDNKHIPLFQMTLPNINGSFRPVQIN